VSFRLFIRFRGSRSNPIHNHRTAATSRRVTVDWTICVGEDIVEIKIGRVSTDLRSNGVDIVVLGAHTLFVLNEQGIVKTQMRIDFDPAW